MGKKFQSEDLFRIAADHLSDREEVEFRFLAATAEYRVLIGTVFEKDFNLDTDERNLLEKIFSKFRARGIIGAGGR